MFQVSGDVSFMKVIFLYLEKSTIKKGILELDGAGVVQKISYWNDGAATVAKLLYL